AISHRAPRRFGAQRRAAIFDLAARDGCASVGAVWNYRRIGSHLVMARAGHNLRTSYLESNEVFRRPYQKILILSILLLALLLPAASSNFFIHLVNLCFLAAIGALGLMLLTRYCGQISLGHPAFLAIGAYTPALLPLHLRAPFLGAPPAPALCVRLGAF